jgi:hypothetical protein
MKQILIHSCVSTISTSLPLYSLIKNNQYYESMVLAGLAVSGLFIQLTQEKKEKSVIIPKYLPLLQITNMALYIIIGFHNIHMYKSNPVKTIVTLLFPIANYVTLYFSEFKNKSIYYVSHELLHHLFNMAICFI